MPWFDGILPGRGKTLYVVFCLAKAPLTFLGFVLHIFLLLLIVNKYLLFYLG